MRGRDWLCAIPQNDGDPACPCLCTAIGHEYDAASLELAAQKTISHALR
jgi:hypothetical protein